MQSEARSHYGGNFGAATPQQRGQKKPQGVLVNVNKYHAKKTQVGDLTFDSQAEARRYGELLLLNRAGEIRELELQRPFDFMVDGRKVFTYVADFAYWDCRLRKRVVEDVKGVRTPVYKLKKRLIEARYGIEILEVKA